jgi:hypothetical protein
MTKLYDIKSLRPFLPLQSTAAPLRGFFYPMGGEDGFEWMFRYAVDSKGFWLQKNDKYPSTYAKSFENSEIAGGSGLDLDDLEVGEFDSTALQHPEVLRHPCRYGLPGDKPILPLPFTARQFFDWEQKCLREEYVNVAEVRFEHIYFGDDEWLAALEATNPDSAELVRICLAGIPPEQQHATPPALQVGAGGASDSGVPIKAVAAVTALVQGNSTKTPRSDSIDPVIELAKQKCSDPDSTAEVWAQMEVLAQDERPPFLASTKDGLKYHKKGANEYFTRDALDKRLHPEKRGTPAKRRLPP